MFPRNIGANLLEDPLETTIFNFTSFNLSNGITITSQGSNPLTLLATENIFIGGIIDISGENGSSGLSGGGGAGGGAISLYIVTESDTSIRGDPPQISTCANTSFNSWQGFRGITNSAIFSA